MWSSSEKQKRSAIWLHFTSVSADKAKCILCKSVYSYKGGSIQNLKKHLKSKHPTVRLDEPLPKRINPPTQIAEDRELELERIDKTSEAITIASTSVSEAQPLTVGSEKGSRSSKMAQKQTTVSSFVRVYKPLARQKKINGLILNMIVQYLQPFTIVEDKGFRELLNELEPAYQISSRTTFTMTLLKEKYDQVSELLKEKLQMANYVSLTTDHRTSAANEAYLAISAHFITKDWELISVLLDCFSTTERHTSRNISDDLNRVTDEWGIKNKIFSVTTDNASNIVGAVKICGWNHISCFAHTLNLIVQKSLSVFNDLRNKVRKIAEFLSRSTQANAKLFATQKQMSLESTQLKLKNDVSTRWNSTYYMIERIIRLKEPLAATLGLLNNPIEILTEEDWNLLAEICQILKPFERVTAEMSSEKSISLSKVIVVVEGLESVLRRIRTKVMLEKSVELIANLQESLNSRFESIETKPVFSQSTFLDPRFKEKVFSEDRLKQLQYFPKLKQCPQHQ